jgi:hypothetical protein
MKPQYVAKKPIKANRYRCGTNIAKGDDDRLICGCLNTKYSPKQNSSNPCAMSPNITPNKKGNVTAVKMAGLA